MIKRLASYHMMQIWHWLNQKELHCFSITIYGPSVWKQRRQVDSKPSKENVTKEDEYLEYERTSKCEIPSKSQEKKKAKQSKKKTQKQCREEWMFDFAN